MLAPLARIQISEAAGRVRLMVCALRHIRVLGALMLPWIASCVQRAREASPIGEPQQTANEEASPDVAATPRAIPEKVPVVVHSRFNPAPLSPAQRREIVERATRAAPNGERVWFVLLKRNHVLDGEQRYAVDVLFTPHVQSPRLRSGRYVELGGEREFFARLIREAMPDGHVSNDAAEVSTREYCQVSLKETPFDHELRVPQGTLLPFDRPQDFSDQELVEVVDFARSSEGGLDREPIIEIRRQNDQIWVLCGVCEGMLSGMGEMISCERVDGVVSVVSRGTWVY